MMSFVRETAMIGNVSLAWLIKASFLGGATLISNLSTRHNPKFIRAASFCLRWSIILLEWTALSSSIRETRDRGVLRSRVVSLSDWGTTWMNAEERKQIRRKDLRSLIRNMRVSPKTALCSMAPKIRRPNPWSHVLQWALYVSLCQEKST